MNLDTIAHTWKNTDLPNHLVESGRRLSDSRISLVVMTFVNLFYAGGALLVLLTAVTRPSWGAALGAAVCTGLAVASIAFQVRQTRSLRAAEVLLTGDVVSCLRGQLELLRTEERAWDGTVARSFSASGMLIAVLCTVGGAWSSEPFLVVCGVVSGAFIGALLGYGYSRRLPSLRSQSITIQDLIAELAD